VGFFKPVRMADFYSERGFTPRPSLKEGAEVF
jgi:hypothetical protein